MSGKSQGIFFCRPRGNPAVELLSLDDFVWSELVGWVDTHGTLVGGWAENEMILGGDFNAKLKIEKQTEKQEQSRNGKILQELINRKDLDPITTKANLGTWTRYEWNNKEKKSTVDYIVTTRNIARNVTHTIVDEDGGKKVRGNNKKETDHNTIITNIKINNQRKKTYTKKWKINNTEGWRKFNKRLQEINQQNEIGTLEYAEAENIIKKHPRTNSGNGKNKNR